MNLFIEIGGPLAVAVMLTSLVIIIVDGIKRAPSPYYDFARANKLSNTGLTYGIVGAVLAGWSLYHYGYQPHYTGWKLVGIIVLGIIIAAIAASIFAFGGYWAGRGSYKATRALRRSILKSLSEDEQRSLAKTLPSDILGAEVNRRIQDSVRLSLSVEAQLSLVKTLPGDILSNEVNQRIEAGTLSEDEQRSLAPTLSSDIVTAEVNRRIEDGVQLSLSDEAQRSLVPTLSGDIVTAEVLARLDAGKLRLGTEKQRSFAQALRNNVLSAEILARLDAGRLESYEVRRIIVQAPRQSLITAFCDLNLSSSDLTPYYLNRLAKLFGLDRLVAMVSSLDADNLSDDDLKKLADLLDLDRLINMVLIQINTLEERTYTRLDAFDRQMGELNSSLRQSDGRAIELRERLLNRSLADSELPNELSFVNLASLTPDEAKRLMGMVFTNEERRELLSELMETLTRIAQGNEKNNDLEQQRTAEVRKQGTLRRLRSAARNLKDLTVGYGTEQ